MTYEYFSKRDGWEVSQRKRKNEGKEIMKAAVVWERRQEEDVRVLKTKKGCGG